MAFTYNITLATDLDKVRFYIQDTVVADPQFQDEEISAMLAVQGTVPATSLFLVRRLALKYARLCDTSVGDVSESASQLATMYKTLADDLVSQFAASASITVGGISVSVKDSLDADTGAVQPVFVKGQFDDRRASDPLRSRRR